MNQYDPNNTDPGAWPNTVRPGDPVPPNSVVGNSPLWQKPPKKRHVLRNILLASLMVLVGVGVAASLSQPSAEAPVSVTSTAGTPVDNGPTPDPITTPTNKPNPKPTVQPSPKVTHKPAPKLTASQEQAIGAAGDYLDTQSFSRKGLIDQLKFEGFSTKDATFAVDHLKVDWNEQAVGVAKDYLSTQHFSRSGLIGQLKFDGFTTKQAVYGVTKAGL